MNKKNKSSKIIVDEKEILQKTKEFLKNHTNMQTRGVMLELEEKNDGKDHAVAYEKENFIIVLPNGETSSARLYGNWEEALSFVRRILTQGLNSQKNLRIVLAEYELKN